MTGRETYALTGDYRRCPTCEAPIVSPFPSGWEMELVKEGPPEGPVAEFHTPHTDGCGAPYADPRPGIAIRVPASVIAGVSVDMAASLTRPVAPPDASPWNLVGYTDAGGTSPDGIAWTFPDGGTVPE